MVAGCSRFSAIAAKQDALGVGDVRTAQEQVLGVAESDVDVRLSQTQAFAIINFPAEEVRSAQMQLIAPVLNNVDVRVAQVQVLAVVRGRSANPQVRAWRHFLDGHENYVLRLGDRETLIYDALTERWVNWADRDLNFWRPSTGVNWIGGVKLANTFNSNVVVGDDQFGLIWFLDPEQPYDQHPIEDNPTQEIYFDRIVMGQVVIRGRQSLPCYAAWLTTDMGAPAYDGAGVTLFTSDDAGATFDEHDTVTVTLDNFSPEISWYSLGQINAPGRLFKIVDDGAVTRIDGLEMNDPDDAG